MKRMTFKRLPVGSWFWQGSMGLCYKRTTRTGHLIEAGRSIFYWGLNESTQLLTEEKAAELLTARLARIKGTPREGLLALIKQIGIEGVQA